MYNESVEDYTLPWIRHIPIDDIILYLYIANSQLLIHVVAGHSCYLGVLAVHLLQLLLLCIGLRNHSN